MHGWHAICEVHEWHARVWNAISTGMRRRAEACGSVRRRAEGVQEMQAWVMGHDLHLNRGYGHAGYACLACIA